MAQLLKSVVGKGKTNNLTDVKMVQFLLNRYLIPSPKLPEIGKFGSLTEKAVIAFQKQEHLEPDGVLGINGETIKKLLQKYTSSHFEKLPLKSTGFYGKQPASELFGTKRTIASLKLVGSLLQSKHGLVFGVVDISLSTGGYFHPHSTHRLGTQVDIRPLRKDDKEDGTNINDDSYSKEKTEKLVKILIADANVHSICFNDLTISGVKWLKDHDHHLHVNFKE